MEISLTPLGVGTSVSTYVARCVDLIDRSGLDYQLHAMGTVVEGQLDALLTLLQQCIDALLADCDRVTVSAKFDCRKGASGRLRGKVDAVEQRLGHRLKT